VVPVNSRPFAKNIKFTCKKGRFILRGGNQHHGCEAKIQDKSQEKGTNYTISENKEPQNSRYLTIIRRAWQRHERKYINNTSMYSKHTQTINKGIHKEVATD